MAPSAAHPLPGLRRRADTVFLHGSADSHVGRGARLTFRERGAEPEVATSRKDRKFMTRVDERKRAARLKDSAIQTVWLRQCSVQRDSISIFFSFFQNVTCLKRYLKYNIRRVKTILVCLKCRGRLLLMLYLFVDILDI